MKQVPYSRPVRGVLGQNDLLHRSLSAVFAMCYPQRFHTPSANCGHRAMAKGTIARERAAASGIYRSVIPAFAGMTTVAVTHLNVSRKLYDFAYHAFCDCRW